MIAKIYLSYELSYSGDYDGLYVWLDKHGAIECGDGTCLIKYNCPEIEDLQSNENSNQFLDYIRKDISENVNIKASDRIYIILELTYHDEYRMMGCFLFGARKDAPWTGRSKQSLEDINLD